jgi:hypothetical protein
MDLLLVHVWHSNRDLPLNLTFRSQLFMAMLMGKSCCDLVAQALPCYCFAGVFSLSLSLPPDVSHF